MKEKVKKILSVVVLLTALISMCVVSVAATDFDDDQNLETDLDYSEDTTYSMLRGNNLNFGTTSVKKMASNKVAVSGITQCHHACDKVYLTLTLERKVLMLSFQVAITTESVVTMQQKTEAKNL